MIARAGKVLRDVSAEALGHGVDVAARSDCLDIVDIGLGIGIMLSDGLLEVLRANGL